MSHSPIENGDFERDTAVHGENGRYRARVSQAWEIWGPNGGYITFVRRTWNVGRERVDLRV